MLQPTVWLLFLWSTLRSAQHYCSKLKNKPGQVVHLAVFVYFGVSLIADQWIIWRKPGDEEVDVVFPFFIAFKFLFIFG